MKHPIQPVEVDEDGTRRFKANAIVRFLLDAAKEGRKVDMNLLAIINFPLDDRQHFAQLIGYSLCGYEELSYCDGDVLDVVDPQPAESRPPDTPRPERILPTEPGDWRVRVAGGRPNIVAVVAASYPVPELRRPLRDPEEGTLIVPDHDGDEVTWGGFDWMHAIPTPEQLSAMSAQLTAGQALADAAREGDKSIAAFCDIHDAFMAAFPAGGAR